MEPKAWLPCPPKPAIGLDPEADKSSLCPVLINSVLILLSHVRPFLLSGVFQSIFRLKFLCIPHISVKNIELFYVIFGSSNIVKQIRCLRII